MWTFTCLRGVFTGTLEKLPKAVRKPMAELARAWQEQLSSVIARKS